MRKLICLMLSAALMLSVDAWGDTQATTAPATSVSKSRKCVFPRSRKRAPDWVCSAHADGLSVAAVGSFAKSGAGIAFMEQMAAADARTRLARNLRGSVQNKIMNSAGSANKAPAASDGALITKITNESLQGAKIVSSAYGPDGKLYVLVGLDEANAQAVTDTISAAYLARKRK